MENKGLIALHASKENNQNVYICLWKEVLMLFSWSSCFYENYAVLSNPIIAIEEDWPGLNQSQVTVMRTIFTCVDFLHGTHFNELVSIQIDFVSGHDI